MATFKRSSFTRHPLLSLIQAPDSSQRTTPALDSSDRFLLHREGDDAAAWFRLAMLDNVLTPGPDTVDDTHIIDGALSRSDESIKTSGSTLGTSIATFDSTIISVGPNQVPSDLIVIATASARGMGSASGLNYVGFDLQINGTTHAVDMYTALIEFAPDIDLGGNCTLIARKKFTSADSSIPVNFRGMYYGYTSANVYSSNIICLQTHRSG